MKRNTLTTAVVAGLTGMAGMVSVTNAVNVDPEGTGQVLLYPYYSARGGNDTLVSIVNSTNRGKAVKIRFREAINSRDVLDFHIYMSAFDVWTAAVTKATDTDGARLKVSDKTCTVPSLGGEQAFLDFDYTTKENKSEGVASKVDGGPTGIERTASGYIEVIEMGTLNAHPSKKPDAKKKAADYISWATKHTSKGVPNDCQALVNAWTKNAGDVTLGDAWVDKATTGINDPTGGLYGAASIINVSDGTMFSYNATAIDDFNTGTAAHTIPGKETPNLLSSGTVTYSNVFAANSEADNAGGGAGIGDDDRDADDNDMVVKHNWVTTNGEDDSDDKRAENVSALLALDAVLMANSVSNEYTTDSTAGAETEWVVTMPTKKFRADTQIHPATGKNATGVPLKPFTRRFDKTKGACEDMTFTYWDREERSDSKEASPTPPVVSPAPPPGSAPDVFSLCREANVIRFASDGSYPDASGILKEPKRADTPHGYTNFDLDYSEGWVSLNLAEVPKDSDIFDTVTKRQSVAVDEFNNLAGKSVAAAFKKKNRDVYEGLPVIGFAVTSYTNGNLGDGVLANYGGTFQNRTTRSIVSS